MVLRTVYPVLLSLTLLAVIAASGAVMAISGRGRDVFVFSTGVAAGMSLVLSLVLSLGLWHLLPGSLATMQRTVAKAVTALRSREGHLSTNQYAIPQRATDVQLELECRRLLDRMHQLLAKAVREDGYCLHCERWGEHSTHCPVPAAQRLYQQGKDRRVPWRAFKKTLPQDTHR